MSGQPIQLMRTSERATYRRCRWRWQRTYVDRLSPPYTAGALKFGTMIHGALEEWYPPGEKRGTHPAEAFEKLFASQPHAFDQWDEEGNKYDALDLGVGMLNRYVDLYGDDREFIMIAPEMTFAIDVYDKHGNYLVTYVGKIDGVYRRRSNGRIGLLEHKSAKNIEYVRLNSGYGEQGMSYWWAATITLRDQGILGPTETIQEVLFNFLRKALPPDKPQNAQGHYLNKPTKDALLARVDELNTMDDIPGIRKMKVDELCDLLRNVFHEDPLQLGEVSKTQPPPFFSRQKLDLGSNQLENFNRRLRMEAWEMRQVRSGKAPTYKNPTKDCSWDCPFRDPCEIHEMGGDWKGAIELGFTTWDPYNDHELQEERH